MLNRLTITGIIVFFFSCCAFAQQHDAHMLLHDASEHENKPVPFIENKGQWPAEVRYAADIPGGKVFIRNTGLTYTFCATDNLHDELFHRMEGDPLIIDCHAFMVDFPDANAEPVFAPAEMRTEYYNFFLGNDQSKWAGNVHAYEEIYIREVWEDIDLRFYSEHGNLKYDFIVHPGGDAGLIAMKYRGLEGMEADDRALKLKTSVNELEESIPAAWQEKGGQKQDISCRFELTGDDLVSFDFQDQPDPEAKLIIDPVLVFASYTGSTADNFGFTATYDDAGNLYGGGIAFNAGYPVTPGAYQINYAGGSTGSPWGGGFEVSISKFNPNGTSLVYSTYLGGAAGIEQPQSLIINGLGELVVYGRTYSNDFPVSANAYDPSYNGNSDIFVTRFNAAGSALIGSTFIGGSANDGLNISTNWGQSSLKYNYGDDSRGEVNVDQNNNIYIASCTHSNNFPVSVGAFQSGMGGGLQDGCVVKFTPDLSGIVWSTYLGGLGDDAAYGIAVRNNQSVFVTGGTTSNNFPTTAGTLNPIQPGGIDGFVTNLDATGSSIISSTYIGTLSYDQTYFIQTDKQENVYLLGQTAGNFPLTGGIYGNPNGGQFVIKINPALDAVVFSTRFGTGSGSPDISPTAFLVDVCEYIYISGWGGQTNFVGTTTGLPVTANAHQSATDGSDFYLMVLEKDAIALDYATYFGGPVSREHVDGGTSRFNKKAEVYQAVCAGCGSNDDFPTTSGAWSNFNNSNNCNLGVFKFEFPLPGIAADFLVDPSQTGCAPHAVNFTNTSIGGVTFIWDFGDGNGASSFHASHTYPVPGTYDVTLIVIDSNSCNIADTAIKQIIVYPPPPVNITPDTFTCDGIGIGLSATGGGTYQWSPPTGLSSTTVPNPVANPPGPMMYTVVVTSPNGCTVTDSVYVDVFMGPSAQTSADTMICKGDTVQVNASGGVGYQWSPAGSVSNPNIANPLVYPGTSTNYQVIVTDINGCRDTSFLQVDLPQINANAGPDGPVCIGDSIQLSGSGNGTYFWTPAAGLNNQAISNPMASPSDTTIYYLTVTHATGCTETDSMQVIVNPLPIVSAAPDTIICENFSVTLQGSGGTSYLWSPGFSLNDSTVQNPLASPVIDTRYVVWATDINGCTDSSSVLVEVLEAPDADAGADLMICEDSIVMLNGSGGVSYLWTPSNTLSNAVIPNPVASPTTTTQYILTVNGLNGCPDNDTVMVLVTPTPVAGLGPDIQICELEPANLTATGGTHYLWSTGDTGSAITVYPNDTMTYWVIPYVNGCPGDADTVSVLVDKDLPVASFDATPDSGWIALTVNTLNNSSANASKFFWNFGDGSGTTLFEPSHTYTDTGAFYIRLIAETPAGCRDTAYHRIKVIAAFTIYVPTAFTPNGDGINDVFRIPWIGVKDYHLMIFDRWGKLIFETDDQTDYWDGTYHGQVVQEGAYVWVVKAKGYLNETFRQAGTVTLFR